MYNVPLYCILAWSYFNTPVYNFINDRLVDESAVLRHLILYVFRYFSRKWQKISDCECPDLIQNETPVHFLYGIRKTAHPDRVRSSLHNNRKSVSTEIQAASAMNPVSAEIRYLLSEQKKLLLFTPNSVTSNDYSPFKMPLRGRGCNHSIINTMAHSLTARCQACVWTVTKSFKINQKILMKSTSQCFFVV